MKPVAELIAVPGKSFPALVFADGFRDLPAGTKLYVGTNSDENERVALGLENCDWSGVPMGNKAILQHAIDRLRMTAILDDAIRYKWATYVSDNADKLHSVVLCHEGNQEKINDRIDWYRGENPELEK